MSDSEPRREQAQEAGLTATQQDWMRVYGQCYDELRGYFARHVRCPHDVDDLVQEVFLNLLAQECNPRDARAYVYTVARHRLCRYGRRARRSKRRDRTAAARGERYVVGVRRCDWELDPPEQLSRRETLALVGSLLDCLSPALREALRLRFFEGLPFRAAAVQAGCGRDTLKKRLTRATRALLTLCTRAGLA